MKNTEFKGTKGDWIAKANESYWEVTTNRSKGTMKDGHPINNFNIFKTEFVNGHFKSAKVTDPEVEANAKLISAAPDLLAALENLLIHSLENDLHSQFTIHAQEAINKALGNN